MQIKGTEKTQRPLCHGPLMTASYMSQDDFFKLLKRFIPYLYVCMHVCMHALTYLFSSIQRTLSEEDKLVGHLPRAGCARASLGVSGDRASCRFRWQTSLLDPLSFREAAQGREQPSPNTDLWLWARPFGGLRCMPLLPTPRQGGPEKNPTILSQDALKPQA